MFLLLSFCMIWVTCRGLLSSRTVSTAAHQRQSTILQAFDYGLLFDCDGVILETEDLHRRAYNAAFKEFDLRLDGELVVWDEEYYDFLQNNIGGGKPKMFFHFRNTTCQFPSFAGKPAPASAEEEQALINRIQDWKTAYFKQLVATEAVARPGLLSLMDEALDDPALAVGVCSASTKEAALKTLDVTLGPERVSRLNCCILGDDVSEKKPSPLIYNTARESLGIEANQCVVIEDSLVGLRAAVAASMKCIITYTSSTADQDFYGEGAVAKVPDLASRNVHLDAIFGPIRSQGMDKADILAHERDPLDGAPY